jgi:cell division protein FtsB
MDTRNKSLARIAAVVVLSLALVYAVQLAGLVMANQRAARAEAQLKAEVEALAASVAAIETSTAQTAGDDYVERWAREERKWVRPGDRPVAPVVATPAPTPIAPSPAPDGGGPIERLMRWLGGG